MRAYPRAPVCMSPFAVPLREHTRALAADATGKAVEPFLLKTPAQGAATQIYCALRAPASQSGAFFRNTTRLRT